MKNKNVSYSIITLSILLITQLIIRNMGMKNISVRVFIALIVIGCLLVIFGTYKDGEKGFGIRYNTIVAILLIVASVSIAVTIIIIKGYPTLMDVYGRLFLIISLVSYFALGLFIIIYRVVYEAKRK